ncbi:nucleoside hydrolase [Chryseomicrobium sp. FSL W7-1435]|uniref:nucleoside hydrolase n=1 Tax=Chryseomicrobium sp. FSL W7-1435 TaxID=2921704 RepID=UPI00315A7D97
MTKTPVIIDCDPGIDDVMALLLAFASDELDIRLITTEPGNQTQDKTIYNARAFASYMKQNIEIARGLDAPFFRQLAVAGYVHGETGLGNWTLPEPTLPESDRTAIEAMKDVLMTSEEPIVLIATGPLTNIAALLFAHPEVKPKIRYISYMGGAAVGGNTTPTTEFNVFVDPHAADIVFRSGVPIVMSGLDLTHKSFVTLEEIAEIEALGTELAEQISSLLKFYTSYAKQTPFHEENYETNIRLHDLCAVSYVVRPELFKGDDYHVEVEIEGRLTAGTTVVDYMERTGLPKNVHVLHTVDRDAFRDHFFEAIKKMDRYIEKVPVSILE